MDLISVKSDVVLISPLRSVGLYFWTYQYAFLGNRNHLQQEENS